MSAQPNWAIGYVPTASEWNSWWAQKLDNTDPILSSGPIGGPFLPLVGGTLTGSLTAPYMSITGADDSLGVSSLNIGPYTHTSTMLQPRGAIGINWDYNITGGPATGAGVINTITDVYGAPNAFIWPLNIQLNLRTTGSSTGQHVGIASTVRRYSGTVAAAWCYFGQHIDWTGAGPTGQQQVGFELDLMGSGSEVATSVYDPHLGARAHFNLVNNSYLAPVWTANAAHAIGDVVRANPTNGFTYIAQTAGTSSSTQPTWPLSTGTVTDGTVAWAFGTNVPYQVSRAINIGSANQASYGAAIHTLGPFYDAILELSFATLDTTTNPNAAAIRLAAGMPIDFSGGQSLATQNLHTLRYDSASSKLIYAVGGVAKWSVDASGNMRCAGTVTGSVTP